MRISSKGTKAVPCVSSQRQWRMRASLYPLFSGVGFTFVIASIGLGLSKLPVFNHVGALASSIFIAVLYRQVAGYPSSIKIGLQFSSKRLLRLAIVLFGLKLNIQVVLHQGLGLLVLDAFTIAFSILAMTLLSKWLKADKTISLLLGVGTGVCGAAAIAAVSPILETKEEDTALGVGLVAFVGTCFALIYTALRPILPMSSTKYGVWCGISLHEIAHVALAAAPAGQSALAIALLAKLGRVFLLMPLCLVLLVWKRKMGKGTSGGRIEFPWFLVGFLAMSLVGTFATGHSTGTHPWMGCISWLSTFILAMAMAGLGLNVSFQDVAHKARRPLLVMVATSVMLTAITYGLVFI